MALSHVQPLLFSWLLRPTGDAFRQQERGDLQQILSALDNLSDVSGMSLVKWQSSKLTLVLKFFKSDYLAHRTFAIAYLAVSAGCWNADRADLTPGLPLI